MTNKVELNDNVRDPASGNIGSVIRIYPEFADYGDPKTHLVRFNFDSDDDRELVWFAPVDLEVVQP